MLNNIRKLYFGAAIAILASLYGCSDILGPLFSRDISSITGNDYELVSLELPDHDIALPSRGIDYHLEFLTDSTISGKCDCNSYWAHYESDDDSIRFYDFGITEIYCGELNVCEEYVYALANTTRYRILGRSFSLYYSDEELEVKYKKH